MAGGVATGGRLQTGTYSPAAGTRAGPSPASGAADLMAQLVKLGEMKIAGLITDEEFTAAKAKLLA